MRRGSVVLLLFLLAAVGVAPLHAQTYAGADQPMQGGFGQTVVVVDGEVLVGEAGNIVRPGIVYVYRRGSDGEWAEAARLTAPEGAPGDGFGASLAVDGETLLVGGEGAAFAFRRQGGEWSYVARLELPEEGGEPMSAGAVAVSGDLALVGAPMAGERRGTVYVFERDGQGWSRTIELMEIGMQPGTGFGAALATNGEWALVGAPAHSERRGAVFAYHRSDGGLWQRAGNLAPEDLGDGSAFGAALVLRNEFLVVGAPGHEGGMGAVHVMRYDGEEAGWTVLDQLLAFDGAPRNGFGAAVALGENTVWVGAPGADDFRGAVYAFQAGPGSTDWSEAERLSSNTLKVRDLFGASAAAGDQVAAVGVSGADYGAGTVVVFERGAEGEWVEVATVLSETEGFPAVTGGTVPCGPDGVAARFDCQNVSLVSFLPVNEMGAGRGVRTNDIWGWTDPESGKEYALVGLVDQTSFVDISDPENPVYVGRLPKTEGSPGAVWRDMKVYENHVFVVADASEAHGMQVFDLTRLREFAGEPITFEPDTTYHEIHSAHNIVINTETGFAYAVGSSSGGETCGGGLHMIDIRDPVNPTFAGCFSDPQTGRASTGYTHDAQCVVYRGPDEDYQGREICLGANETALSIADVTDKDNPVALSRASYPNVAYSHQGWLTDDHRYFYLDDELDEIQGSVERTRTMIWDVADLEDPQLVAEFFGPTSSSDHNLYVVGDLIFQSNYQSGLRILDASNPTELEEVGYFDTVPYGTNTPGFGGSWSNYPFFESGNVIVTSGHEGLFVLRPTVE